MAKISDEIERSYNFHSQERLFAGKIFFKKSIARACIYGKKVLFLHVISGIGSFREWLECGYQIHKQHIIWDFFLLHKRLLLT